MPMTSGNFFANLLLGVTPTALGRALDHNPADITTWNNDLLADKGDDAVTLGMLSSILTDPGNALLYNALLTTVKFQGQSVPVGQVLVQKLWTVGNTAGVLNKPWSIPPHPSGSTDISSLINTVGAFDETK